MMSLQETIGRYLPSSRHGHIVRFAIAAGMLALLAVLLWSHRYRSEQTTYRVEQAELLSWMQANEAAVRDWQAQHPNASTGTHGSSLVATVSALAQVHDLPVIRASAEPNGAVTIALGDARFDQMIAWIDELAIQQQRRIEWISLTRASAPGLVDAQVRVR